jgi:hypothetical protein
MATTTGAPRSAATLGVLAAVCVAATLYGARDILTWMQGPGISPSGPPGSAAAVATTPTHLTVAITGLGRSPVSRFAFDPAVAGRVVACEAESRDGGRTWPPLEVDPMRRPMLLGGPKAAPPVAGPEGRILCGDVILPGPNGPSGLGQIQPAAEWTGSGWRSAGLPPAAADGTDTTLDAVVGYDAQGQALAVRADRLLLSSGTVALPGRAQAFAVDGAGTFYAAVASATKRTTLMWTASPDGPWSDVPSPGRVRALAADGGRAWAVAEMLGRGTGGTWQWTRWPAMVMIDGVTGRGDFVVAWGGLSSTPYHRGVLVVSRDGGATVGYAPLERLKPVWVAIDPHAEREVLVVGDDGALARLRLQ